MLFAVKHTRFEIIKNIGLYKNLSVHRTKIDSREPRINSKVAIMVVNIFGIYLVGEAILFWDSRVSILSVKIKNDQVAQPQRGAQ